MIVSIRPLKESDAFISYKWRNDPEVFKYTGRTYDKEIDSKCEVEWLREVIKRTTEYRCAILADNVYVGNIYLTDITQKSATYHIFIGEKDYWGKGVAKKASLIILEYAFNVLGLELVNLSVKTKNESARRLYERLGFLEQSLEGDWIHMSLSHDTYMDIITCSS